MADEKEERREERKEQKEQKQEAEKAPAKPEKREKTAFEIIFHPKPAKLLTLLLQERIWYPSDLAKESGQSYVYASKLIKQFEQKGVVVLSLKGKRSFVKLTEKGEKIAKGLSEIENTL